MNIWQKLAQNKPFFALAPLDDVTDTVFREVVARAAAPDVYFTEFANSAGYVHPTGRGSVMRKLMVNDSERELGVPLIAQIWGSNPDHFEQMARELAATGLYAGIDINMGCPEKGICKRGCCAALIENPDLASKIIRATQRGVGGSLPVSVKTRLGYKQIKTEEWVSHLLKHDLAALTVHLRTAKEMSKVPAHWEEIPKIIKLRDQIAPGTVIIGNGDVASLEQGRTLTEKYGVDGAMIGRGIFQDIFVFNPHLSSRTGSEALRIRDLGQRLDMLKFHLDLWEKTWGDKQRSFDPLKKFIKVYISGFAGAAELRDRLMKTKSPADAKKVIADQLTTVN